MELNFPKIKKNIFLSDWNLKQKIFNRTIGYITYWSFIASFSWLTVYCFDYYRIFR
jgi:hypothetical protein